VELLELGDELAPGGFHRSEIAHDDVGDERGPQSVGGSGGGDDRAGELEHRPEKVARELIVVDHQHVDSLELRHRCAGHT
jgi:hypothetical protein